MASGIARSPWLRAMADRLGWKTQKLRVLLNKHGYDAPYLDEQRALRILAKAGHPVPSVAPVAAVKEGTRSVITKSELKNVEAAAAQTKGKPPTEGKRGGWGMKLIPRLARLLPEKDTLAGKGRVRKILREGGYEGPRWDDEARALAIFKAKGISIDGFERLSNGATKTPPSSQVTVIPARPVTTVQLDSPETQRKINNVVFLLNTYEKQVLELIRQGALNRLCAPLDIPITALNELRAHLRA